MSYEIQYNEDANIFNVKAKDLEFGVNIFSGDRIRLKPYNDGMRQITNAKDLDFAKEELDPELEMVINRNKDVAWFDVISTPSWNEKIKAHAKGVQEFLDNHQKDNRIPVYPNYRTT